LLTQIADVYYAQTQEIVSWMGWTPWKISYASNYFDRLHELAVQLIKAGKAFVCHQVRLGAFLCLLHIVWW
jgi:glutamyl/glutaminyl-tRNA synthetase